MLCIADDFPAVKVLRDFVPDDMFEEFAAYAGKGDGPVVSRLASVSFFEDRLY